MKILSAFIVDLWILLLLSAYVTCNSVNTGVTQADNSDIDMQARPILTPVTSLADVSLAVTMICRNEDVNFKSNLALWLPVAKYFGRCHKQIDSMRIIHSTYIYMDINSPSSFYTLLSFHSLQCFGCITLHMLNVHQSLSWTIARTMPAKPR